MNKSNVFPGVKMNSINSFVFVLLILVTFLTSVTEGVRIRYYHTRYYYYNYYSYTTYTLSAGVIAGIVIGCLLAVALLVGAIIVCCVCCCGNRRSQAQGGRVIVAQSYPTGQVVSTTQTSAAVAYYPTGNASQTTSHSAPPPSYSQVTSVGNVNLGFQDNK